MRHWRPLFIVILSCSLALAFLMVGCGDDDDDGNGGSACENVCAKMAACASGPVTSEEMEECVTDCEQWATPDDEDCLANCDTDASCDDYGLCLRACD